MAKFQKKTPFSLSAPVGRAPLYCEKVKIKNSTLLLKIQEFQYAPSLALYRKDKCISLSELEFNDILHSGQAILSSMAACKDEIERHGFQVRCAMPSKNDDIAELPASEASQKIALSAKLAEEKRAKGAEKRMMVGVKSKKQKLLHNSDDDDDEM